MVPVVHANTVVAADVVVENKMDYIEAAVVGKPFVDIVKLVVAVLDRYIVNRKQS